MKEAAAAECKLLAFWPSTTVCEEGLQCRLKGPLAEVVSPQGCWGGRGGSSHQAGEHFLQMGEGGASWLAPGSRRGRWPPTGRVVKGTLPCFHHHPLELSVEGVGIRAGVLGINVTLLLPHLFDVGTVGARVGVEGEEVAKGTDAGLGNQRPADGGGDEWGGIVQDVQSEA